MSDFVAVEIQGVEQLQIALKKLPDAVQDAAVDDVTKYYLNVFQSEQPPPKYVTRKAAYGKSFFSERQRKWFFANLRSGNLRIPYHRTGGLRRGWRQVGAGRTSFIANDRDGAPFVVGDDTQSRHEKKVGWYRAGNLMEKRIDRAVRVADAAIKKAIKRLGL